MQPMISYGCYFKPQIMPSSQIFPQQLVTPSDGQLATIPAASAGVTQKISHHCFLNGNASVMRRKGVSQELATYRDAGP